MTEELDKLRQQIESIKADNIHYKQNPEMFNALVEEVMSHPTAYGRRFKSKRMQWLRDWVHQQLLFLDNGHHSFDEYGANECAYIVFYGMTDFPKCPIDGTLLDDPKHFKNIFLGFSSCSKECGEQLRQQHFVQTCIDRYGVPHYASNKQRYEERCDNMKKKYGVRNVFSLDSTKQAIRQTKKEKYGDEKYINVELMRKNRYEKYDGKWESEEAKQKRKQSFIDHYGVDHNMKSAQGLKAHQDAIEKKYGEGIRNISQIESVKKKKTETCKEHFGVEYALQSPEGLKKFEQTCIDVYGVPYPMQNHDVFKKSRSKYFYDGQWFDSAPEIAFYIWLKDNDIPFEYQPCPGIPYEADGNIHMYFPDFKVGDIYFEIKGDQFFKDGHLVNPFKTTCDVTLQQKWKCMMMNAVVVLRYNEYRMFILYVKQRYGCNYLKQFKMAKKKKKCK